jgi:endoglucanase
MGFNYQEGNAASGYLHTRGNKIVDASGAVVGFSGLNWFGFETTTYAPHGLWTRNWQEMLDQIQSLGYNTIRLPFSNAMLKPGIRPTGIDFTRNPDLAHLTAIEVMDRIIAGAGAHGMRVILDNHRSTPGDGPESGGLWYTREFPESRWIEDWKMLAARYLGNSTVVGVDLRNEPYGACWSCGDTSMDWRAAAERAGNAILSVNPDLLIIVEGVATYNGRSTWWGGNLMGARDNPVRLSVPERLVYSPHEYPESVYPHPWFSDPSYPRNLPAVWEQYWGYLVDEKIAPVLIGEFGTHFTSTSDQQWMQTLGDYIQQKELSWTFWALNPNSRDTGGLLLDDWQSVHQGKQELLAEIQYPFDGSTPPATSPPWIIKLPLVINH